MSNIVVSSILSALGGKAKIAILVVCALILLAIIFVIIYFARKKKHEQRSEEKPKAALPVEEKKPEEPLIAPTYVEDVPEEFPEETASEESEEDHEVTLSESIAAAKDSGTAGIVTKKSVIEHLAAKFGDNVELNGRENRTPNGKLLMSDNHFAFSKDGKRVCFAYVYQDDDGDVIVLLRTTAEHAHAIRAAHPHTGAKSAFPKNKEKDWYSVVIDGSFTANDVYEMLDVAAYNIIGKFAPVHEEPEEEEEVSLSESLAAAKDVGAAGLVTKKSIIDHLSAKFGDKVELNGRENRTPNGKLLLSDNHFAFAPNGKRVCFTYVYEDDEGDVVILLRTTADHAKAIHEEHEGTCVRSAFPKNKEKDWYSVVIDDSFTEQDVYDELDRAALNIIGGAPAEHEFTLSESLAAARESGVSGIVTKKSVIDYLAEKYGDNVELNGRENRTPNGKLLMSDNHFALSGDKRVCFTYVYEDEGKVIMLVRLDEKTAAAVHAEHSHTCVRSAFPKNKDRDWYSVVVDGSFTGAVVYEVLDKAYAYVLKK